MAYSITQLRGLLRWASKMPWRIVDEHIVGNDGKWPYQMVPPVNYDDVCWRPEDIELIVAAVNALPKLLDEIEWLKSDLYHAIQALHCSAPNELMSVEEIRAWLEIRNTLSDKYKEAT